MATGGVRRGEEPQNHRQGLGESRVQGRETQQSSPRSGKLDQGDVWLGILSTLQPRSQFLSGPGVKSVSSLRRIREQGGRPAEGFLGWSVVSLNWEVAAAGNSMEATRWGHAPLLSTQAAGPRM